MPWPGFGVVAALGVCLWVVDRIMRAAEARGWIHWRQKGGSSRAGSAMLSVHSILEPDKQHVVEEQRQQDAEIDIAGDDQPLG